MSGRRKAELVLRKLELGHLNSLTMWRKTAQASAMRAPIVLACVDGINNKTAAVKQRVGQQTVSNRRTRFVEHHLNGLFDAPRPGTPRTIHDTKVDAVIARTLESIPARASRWSTSFWIHCSRTWRRARTRRARFTH